MWIKFGAINHRRAAGVLAGMCLAFSAATHSSAQTDTTPPDNATSKSTPKDPSKAGTATPRGTVVVKCAVVKDWGFFRNASTNRAGTGIKTGPGAIPLRSPNANGAAAPPSDICANAPFDTLIGAGDLQVVVESASFAQLMKDRQEQPGAIDLYLNGVPLPNDASFMGGEDLGTESVLNYRISQGAETQKLWSMLFADQGMFIPQPLHVGLTWRPATGPTATTLPARPEKDLAFVAITTEWHFGGAVLLILLLVGLVIYLALNTDTLRDDALPQWWGRAIELRAKLAKLTPSEQNTKLASEFASYSPANQETYSSLADAALGHVVINGKEEQEQATIGLALRKERWAPVRASFSLTKVQFALWFTFAVATGLFLWVLYGDLRRIDNSTLGLLGISVGSAGFSWATDRAANGRPYTPTQGFWADLVTGFDLQQQAHRYQAVVVNLLLLFVGIFHVVEQLSWPVFEPTWLLLLGVSGAAFGVGKQMIEKPVS